MDRRPLGSRKDRPHNARPYDRQNQQGIGRVFGRVYSTFKGIFNPSWLTNWIGNSEEHPQSLSDDTEEGTIREDSDASACVPDGSKRRRLNNNQTVPSIQSSGTQTWPEQPPQNLYETISHVQSPTTQSSLLENKETIGVLNGDDHSENSEGSASTSGCSSLVSSHKESNRLVESSFVNLLELKNSRKRKFSPSKSGINDLENSRTLWSSNFSPKFQRRLPTISHTNQPNFNLSSFVAPSKLNDSMEKKVSSPFYEGRTTFGGASSLRRMPPSATPYQTDRNARNKIRAREQKSDDTLEGMSSAAKRILLTLEKMNTPVADAKKIPNSDTSPIDLSLYLTPPKSRRNSQFTPSIASKGPPIVNINTIEKLATLKNYGASRLRSTLLSPSPSNSKTERKSQYKSTVHSKPFPVETDLHNTCPLTQENIPIPTTCVSKAEKTSSDIQPKFFIFSNPIEHELPNNILPKENVQLPILDSKIEKCSDQQLRPFVFSNPIEHELPSKSAPTKENVPLPVNSSISTAAVPPVLTWDCSSCWVSNPNNAATCAACEAPRIPMERSSTLMFKGAEETKVSPTTGSSTTVSVSATGFAFSNPSSSPMFKFGSPKTENQTSISSKPLTFGLGSKTSTWECDVCWVRNSETDLKCKACEAACPKKESESVKKVNNTVANVFSTWECTSCWVRNPVNQKKCIACETLHPSADVVSGFTLKTFTKPNPAPTVSTPSDIGLAVSSSTPTSVGFKFGISKTDSLSATTSTSPLSSGLEKSQTTAVSTSQSVYAVVSSGKLETGLTKDEAKTTLFLFASGSPLVNTTEVTQADKTNFKFGDNTSVNTTPIITTSSSILAAKSEASHQVASSVSQNTTVTNSKVSTNFVFGSKSDVDTKIPSTIPKLSDHTFGSSNSVFNGKNENTNTTSEITTAVFGSATTVSSVFGNNSKQSTEPDDKPSSGGFKFGVATTSGTPSAAFQFGTSNKMLPVNKATNSGTTQSSTWECSACWVRNQEDRTTCIACETSKNPSSSNLKSSNSEETKNNSAVTTTASVSSSAFSFGSVASSPAGFSFGAPKSENQTVVSSKTFSFGSGSNATTWDCKSCLTRNPETEAKCVGCKLDRSTKSGDSKTVNSNLSTAFSTWECTKCSARNSMKEKKCTSCETLTPNADQSSGFIVKSFEKPQDSTSVSAPTVPSAITVLNTGATGTTSSGGFPFGISKAETQNSTISPFVFGSVHGPEKSQSAPSISSSSSSQSATPGLNVSTSTAVPTGGFVFGGAPKNDVQNTPAQPFSFGSGPEKPPTMPSLPASTSQTTTSGLNIGSTSQIPTGGFVFGAPKTETQNTLAPPFAFGSGATSSSNTSAFSAFQPNQPTNQTFKFGSQPSSSTALTSGTSSTFSFAKNENTNKLSSSLSQNPASAFGSSPAGFVFGSKSDTSNQIPSTVAQPSTLAFGSSTNFTFTGKNETNTASQNAASPAFGSSSMQSVFGNTAVQPFGGADKPTSSGFNFGVASTGVFQFGASSNNNAEKKRTATASGFTFGGPSAPETNNSFSPSFNINTPNFNFGASSTPAVTSSTLFQFAASTAARSAPTQNASGARKYRKAVRRVTRKD